MPMKAQIAELIFLHLAAFVVAFVIGMYLLFSY
jgi:hypothetical protein